jgi:hypothetical protein
MIKACQINKNFMALEIGETFIWKTTKRIDECVVVGLRYIDGCRIPTAVRTFPEYRFTEVHEIHDI